MNNTWEILHRVEQREGAAVGLQRVRQAARFASPFSNFGRQLCNARRQFNACTNPSNNNIVKALPHVKNQPEIARYSSSRVGAGDALTKW